MIHLGDRAVRAMIHDGQALSLDLLSLCADGLGWWNLAWTTCSGYNSDISWIWSTFIPVGPGKIVYKAYLYRNVGHLTAWDENGIELGYVTGAESGSMQTGEWVLPAGTKFVRICALNPDSPTGQRYNQSIWFEGVSPLPHRFQMLDYLESTGTQYIETGIRPTATMVQDLRFTPTVPSGDSKFYGMAGTGGVFMGTLSGKYRLGTSLSLSSISVLAQKTRSLSVDTQWLIDGQTATASAVQNVTNTMLLFACKHTSYGVLYGKVRIHQFLLSTALDVSRYGFAAASPVACFIPARDLQTGDLGMYETVSGGFYKNLGTGLFVAGPSV